MIMANTLREKLTAGRATSGTHFLSADPDTPEIIGDTGLFDYGEYCAEYSAFDMQLLYPACDLGVDIRHPRLVVVDSTYRSHGAIEFLAANELGLHADVLDDSGIDVDGATCTQLIGVHGNEVHAHG